MSTIFGEELRHDRLHLAVDRIGVQLREIDVLEVGVTPI
jgi:hypothetical protein